jgi:hypothetical protein
MECGWQLPRLRFLPTSILHAMPIIHDEKAVMVPAIDETRGSWRQPHVFGYTPADR